eukprot:g1396.t1
MDNAASDVSLTTILKSYNVNELLEILKREPTLFIAVSVTVLCGVISLLFLLLWKKASTGKREAILIMGPTGSGKTCLFSKLTGKGWKGTVTSTVPNFGHVKVGSEQGKSVQIIDLPGSSCLAYFAQRYLNKAAMIIFVVDGVDFLHNINDTAEKMWKLLDDPTFKRQPVPILISVNKCDLGARCHTEKFICSRLQREIDCIIKQQPHVAQDQESFSFDELKSEVAMARISAKLEELTPLREFLNKHIT